MTTALLSPMQRIEILADIYQALDAFDPRLLEEDRAAEAGGIYEIENHLDGLIEIVRRTTTPTMEVFGARVRAQICTRCPHQDYSAHCPLRAVRGCVMDSHLRTVVGAITASLKEMGDPGYLMHHVSVQSSN